MAWTDPFFLFSIFLFIASLAVIAWSIRVLAQLRALPQTLTPAAENIPVQPAPPPAAADVNIERLEKTVQSLELSHVEALRMLAGRLDRIEASIQEVRTEHGKRLSALESKTNEISSGTPKPAPQPPPFV